MEAAAAAEAAALEAEAASAAAAAADSSSARDGADGGGAGAGEWRGARREEFALLLTMPQAQQPTAQHNSPQLSSQHGICSAPPHRL